jgi:hypothetical protein
MSEKVTNYIIKSSSILILQIKKNPNINAFVEMDQKLNSF